MNPPHGSERLLRLVLSHRDRETISGDLLEEYREAVLPTLGDTGAAWWYRRQVAGFVWRAARPWGTLAALALVGRYGLDDFVLPHVFDARRAELLTRTVAWIGFFAGAATAWRTRRIASGVVVAAIAGAMASLASYGYVAAVMLGPWSPWSTPADPAEAFIAVPALLLGFNVMFGAIGGCVGQLLSAAERHSSVMFGVAFGTLLGVGNLIDTAVQPLAEDRPPELLAMLAVVLAIWGFAAYRAAHRGGGVRDAVIAGAVIGGLTAAIFGLANIVRVNVFLDAIQYRDDWRNLMLRYHESGYTSLRAYVNREFALGRTVLGGLAGGGALGAVMGALGGAASAIRRSSFPSR